MSRRLIILMSIFVAKTKKNNNSLVKTSHWMQMPTWSHNFWICSFISKSDRTKKNNCLVFVIVVFFCPDVWYKSGTCHISSLTRASLQTLSHCAAELLQAGSRSWASARRPPSPPTPQPPITLAWHYEYGV